MSPSQVSSFSKNSSGEKRLGIRYFFLIQNCKIDIKYLAKYLNILLHLIQQCNCFIAFYSEILIEAATTKILIP